MGVAWRACVRNSHERSDRFSYLSLNMREKKLKSVRREEERRKQKYGPKGGTLSGQVQKLADNKLYSGTKKAPVRISLKKK